MTGVALSIILISCAKAFDTDIPLSGGVNQLPPVLVEYYEESTSVTLDISYDVVHPDPIIEYGVWFDPDVPRHVFWSAVGTTTTSVPLKPYVEPEVLPEFQTLGELVDKYFLPEDKEFILWLAFCESSAFPEHYMSSAVNKSSRASGWFQHLPKFWDERSVAAGFEGYSIFNPEANVAVAAWLFYEDGGARHWECTW
jgi:hypothetical protein